jgi:hypothetical protein
MILELRFGLSMSVKSSSSAEEREEREELVSSDDDGGSCRCPAEGHKHKRAGPSNTTTSMMTLTEYLQMICGNVT